jgi:hypothetical protein
MNSGPHAFKIHSLGGTRFFCCFYLFFFGAGIEPRASALSLSYIPALKIHSYKNKSDMNGSRKCGIYTQWNFMQP